MKGRAIVVTDDDLLTRALKHRLEREDFEVTTMTASDRRALTLAVRKAEKRDDTVFVIGSRAWNPVETVNRVAPKPERMPTVMLVDCTLSAYDNSKLELPLYSIVPLADCGGSAEASEMIAHQVLDARHHLSLLAYAREAQEAQGSATRIIIANLPRSRRSGRAAVLPMFNADAQGSVSK